MMPVKILLVDDQPILMLVMRKFLARQEAITVLAEATTGQEALDRVEELRPDVVVLDLGLPDISGYDIAHKIAVDYPQTKVIVVSAQIDPSAARKALDMGVLGIVPKDKMFEELAQAIMQVADHHLYISDTIET